MAVYNIISKIHAKDFLIDKMSFPCSSKGICGKCKIKVHGNVSKITENERNFLSQSELSDGIRLACFTELFEGSTVETLDSRQNILGLNIDGIKSLNEENIICAIDIGTTTVALAIYDSKSQTVLSEILEENSQKIYGACVISRIEKSQEIGVFELQNTIINQLSSMYSRAISAANISKVDKTVITANTIMLHILEGLDPKTLGFSPFTTVSLFGSNIETLNAYLPKCVSAYVGADFLCSTLASDMIQKNEVSILVDIGTNGEMGIYKNGKLICCSVAAGPAFEGWGLSCGSPAINGAITHVDGTDVSYIGDKITSICGSGIVSLLSTMLNLQLIDDTGRFDDENENLELGKLCDDKFYIKNSETYLSQKDIRQIQLAKSAICAGIYTLLDETETKIQEIDKLYVCGGFGSHLDIKSACNIGLLPKELEEKVIILGNGALAGALKIGLGYEEIPPIYEEVVLSTSQVFMDYYVDCMMF